MTPGVPAAGEPSVSSDGASGKGKGKQGKGKGKGRAGEGPDHFPKKPKKACLCSMLGQVVHPNVLASNPQLEDMHAANKGCDAGRFACSSGMVYQQVDQDYG